VGASASLPEKYSASPSARERVFGRVLGGRGIRRSQRQRPRRRPRGFFVALQHRPQSARGPTAHDRKDGRRGLIGSEHGRSVAGPEGSSCTSGSGCTVRRVDKVEDGGKHCPCFETIAFETVDGGAPRLTL